MKTLREIQVKETILPWLKQGRLTQMLMHASGIHMEEELENHWVHAAQEKRKMELSAILSAEMAIKE